MTAAEFSPQHVTLPKWVPEGTMHYLAHTELGFSIRALARAAGCHASTVLRQVRRVETRRDDPLVDAALRHLGALQLETIKSQPRTSLTAQVDMPESQSPTLPDDQTLLREAMRVLRRLCETGAVLAVAAEMDKAVVVRDTAGGGSTRTAVVASSVAQAMALKDWIVAVNAGRIVRYQITSAGRSALAAMLADPNLAPLHKNEDTLDEGAMEPDTREWNEDKADGQDTPRSRRMRYSSAESPLVALSRKRDGKGVPFLSDVLVHAGERLREDFELAQMGSQVTQDWDRFLTAGVQGGKRGGFSGSDAPSDARARVATALTELGPGLSDVVLRCCCYLEGLESAEKRLGWSARSAKVVLRIALMRLSRHYEKTIGPGGPMIG